MPRKPLKKSKSKKLVAEVGYLSASWAENNIGGEYNFLVNAPTHLHRKSHKPPRKSVACRLRSRNSSELSDLDLLRFAWYLYSNREN